MVHCCIFSGFWTATELIVIVGFGLFMRSDDNTTKNITSLFFHLKKVKSLTQCSYFKCVVEDVDYADFIFKGLMNILWSTSYACKPVHTYRCIFKHTHQHRCSRRDLPIGRGKIVCPMSVRLLAQRGCSPFVCLCVRETDIERGR